MRLAVFFLLLANSYAQDFHLQTSHTKADLRGISSVSSKIAWASGTKGTFLRTTDGGETWVAASVPGAESLDFRDVQAFSENTAYLLAAGPGPASRIFKTTDAGAHWIIQFKNEDPRGFYDCMAFWDEKHGIALGDAIDGEFQLYATDDGDHWRQLPTNKLPTALEGEGAFAASGTCITVQAESNVWFATGGKAARVFHSADRGLTWQAAETPIVHGAEATGIFSIAFLDPKNGVIAGGNYQDPKKTGRNLAYTFDGGETWKLSTLSPQFYFSTAAFTPGHLLVAGTAGAAHATIDGLKSPTAVPFQRTQSLNVNAVSIATDGTIFAVGPKGLIARQ
jgi:photosystem II stability/assembly factor-like uncharacterized protein